jgi:hypothetical protein
MMSKDPEDNIINIVRSIPWMILLLLAANIWVIVIPYYKAFDPADALMYEFMQPLRFLVVIPGAFIVCVLILIWDIAKLKKRTVSRSVKAGLFCVLRGILFVSLLYGFMMSHKFVYKRVLDHFDRNEYDYNAVMVWMQNTEIPDGEREIFFNPREDELPEAFVQFDPGHVIMYVRMTLEDGEKLVIISWSATLLDCTWEILVSPSGNRPDYWKEYVYEDRVTEIEPGVYLTFYCF